MNGKSWIRGERRLRIGGSSPVVRGRERGVRITERLGERNWVRSRRSNECPVRRVQRSLVSEAGLVHVVDETESWSGIRT